MKVNVEKILTFGLAFCLGGIVDSIIKYRRNTKTYTLELKIDSYKIYNELYYYILTECGSLSNYEMTVPLNENGKYRIEVKAHNLHTLNKIKKAYAEFLKESSYDAI